VRTHVLKLGQAQAGKFRRASVILGTAFVMDGQLFTSQHSILWIGDEFKPECGCGGVVAPAFGEQSKLAAGARAEFRGKAEIERLRTSDVGPIGIAAAFEKTRETEEIEAVYSIALCFLRGEKCIDLAKKGGQAAQIHLVVSQNAYKGIRGPSAKIVKVILWNKRRSDVFFAVPPEARRIQNVPFQLDKTHRPETKFPKSARGM
jgi:hypothetical protein